MHVHSPVVPQGTLESSPSQDLPDLDLCLDFLWSGKDAGDQNTALIFLVFGVDLDNAGVHVLGPLHHRTFCGDVWIKDNEEKGFQHVAKNQRICSLTSLQPCQKPIATIATPARVLSVVLMSSMPI